VQSLLDFKCHPWNEGGSKSFLKKMFGMEQRSFKGKSYELLLLFFQRMASLLKYCHGLNHKIFI
jgi:hypothetical protein